MKIRIRIENRALVVELQDEHGMVIDVDYVAILDLKEALEYES